MKLRKYKIILIFGMLLSNLSIFAQETSTEPKVDVDFSADLMSRYIWRGLQFGGISPAIQPGIAIAKSGFEFGAWASYSIGGDNASEELDLYLSYSTKNEMFTITLTDYFFPLEYGNYNYFDYKKASTGHVYEAMMSFNGTEKIPFSFLAALNFYGADAQKVESNSTSADFNMNLGIQYSNYFEIGYSKECKNYDFDAFAGFTLTNPKSADTLTGYIGESAFYGGGAGVINVGVKLSKEVKISENFSLPLCVQLVTNPRDKKIFFVFGMSF
jgi:uncharacterized protein (TIGR02001 family)